MELHEKYTSYFFKRLSNEICLDLNNQGNIKKITWVQIAC